MKLFKNYLILKHLILLKNKNNNKKMKIILHLYTHKRIINY